MNRFFHSSVAATGILVLLAAFGCSDDDSVSSAEANTSAIARVYPVDGSTGLPTSATVRVAFTGPVDTMSVMTSFHLAGGATMHEWRDSLDHSGGWGMMGMSQRSHMVDWMNSIHTAGTFHWNGSRDSCEFTPNGPLDANSNYLCLLDESGMRDHQGGMMGHMGQNDDGYHMFGFATGNGPAGAPTLVSVMPNDGSTGVAPTSSFTMAFDMSMDTTTVMANFHLSGGDAMHLWMDSLGHHMGMGGMGMMGMDHMMNWMDSIQHDGAFHWNGSMDTCVFVPDSTMMPSTDYMMFMNGDIHAHNGEMMNMSQLEYDGHMIHFTTGP